MTVWTAQIRRDPDRCRWAAEVWRLTVNPPPERIEKSCSHPHETQAGALGFARAWRDQLEAVGA